MGVYDIYTTAYSFTTSIHVESLREAATAKSAKLNRLKATFIQFKFKGWNAPIIAITDFPSYSDTVYSDTPLSMTLWACPK